MTEAPAAAEEAEDFDAAPRLPRLILESIKKQTKSVFYSAAGALDSV